MSCRLRRSVERPEAPNATPQAASDKSRPALLVLLFLLLHRLALLLRRVGAPDLHRAVDAARDKPLAIRAERHAGHGAGVAVDRHALLAAGVPDLDRLGPADAR